MAAKPEPEAPAAASPASSAEAPKEGKKSSLGALLPAILAVVLTPALTWAVGQFVLIPQLKKELAAVPAEKSGAATTAAPAHAESKGKEGKGGKGEAASPANGYTFENIVVNLAGTMGTRYLKTTFLVTGSDDGVKAAFEGNHAQLVDVTLNVLSSLSLTDLEEAGAKNIIREKLIQAYNQVFGKKVAEQVFFSDFVVQ